MPDAVLEKIFEPFFTTKGEQGTGLGVPQVGAFMRYGGGHVCVASDVGRGTTFDCSFQQCRKTLALLASRLAPLQLYRRWEHCLPHNGWTKLPVGYGRIVLFLLCIVPDWARSVKDRRRR